MKAPDGAIQRHQTVRARLLPGPQSFPASRLLLPVLYLMSTIFTPFGTVKVNALW